MYLIGTLWQIRINEILKNFIDRIRHLTDKQSTPASLNKNLVICNGAKYSILTNRHFPEINFTKVEVTLTTLFYFLVGSLL